jgi:hypothetical protein
MALTKVTGQVIKNTTDVTVGVLTVTNTLAVGGTVSVGGTLTYEDVTNVDAVGIITARSNILVGSGITLSPDGDIFATGITTVSGNVKVGTGITLSPDGDGFFTGIVTATSFSGETVVGDTSPQLGGNLDVNTKNIVFGDSGGASDDRLVFGAGSDLSVYHDGTDSFIDNSTGGLKILGDVIRLKGKSADETMLKGSVNGAVELYNDNVLTLATKSKGVAIGNTSQAFNPNATNWATGSALNLNGNHGGGLALSDNGLYGVSMYTTNNGQTFFIGMSAKGTAPKTILEGQKDDELKLYHNGNIKLLTKNTGVTVTGIVTTTSGVSNPDALSHRNMLINGDMFFWQRGVNVSGGTALDVFVTRCDRFWWYGPATSSGTVQRSTDVPDGFAYSTHNNCDTSISIGTNVHLYNAGVNAPFVHNQSYTFSFYIKGASATSGNTIAITSRDTREGTGSVTRGTVDTYSTTTGWTRIERTFTLSGTIGGSNAMLQVEFTLDPGEKTTGWQLERGPIATPFEFRNKFDQFQECQRYYQTSYDQEGEPRLNGSHTWSSGSGAMSLIKQNAFYDGLVVFQTQMIRDNYTFKWYSSTAENKARLELPGVGNSEIDVTSWNNLKKTKNGFFFRHIEASLSGSYITGSGNGFMRFAWSADAEF